MWKKWFPKKQLDVSRTYIRVEFLTAEERRLKKQIIERLEKEYMNDDEQIVPYDGSFTTSFKFVMNTKTISGTQTHIVNSMLINQFVCHLEVTTNQELAEFMATYVKDIQLMLHNNEMVSRNDTVPLYSEVDASVYNPKQVLEIIYEPKSLWERIKNKGKSFVKAIPRTCFSIITKIMGLLLSYFGLGGGMTSFVWKFMPTGSILQWLTPFLSLYFPFLGPILTIGSKFIL